MGWFTISKVNMPTGKEIEIISNGLKEKVSGDTTILGSFNRQNGCDKGLVVEHNNGLVYPQK